MISARNASSCRRTAQGDFHDLAISEMEMFVIFDFGCSIPRNLHSVGPDLSPTPLLGVQVLVADASVLKHMPNANLLIVVAILNDRVLQIRGRSIRVISSGYSCNT
jgi:hypothetical protein